MNQTRITGVYSLVARPFCLYQKFWPSDLHLDFWPTFEKTLTLAITFEPKQIEHSYYMARHFDRYQKFSTHDLDFNFWPKFWEIENTYTQLSIISSRGTKVVGVLVPLGQPRSSLFRGDNFQKKNWSPLTGKRAIVKMTLDRHCIRIPAVRNQLVSGRFRGGGAEGTFAPAKIRKKKEKKSVLI